MNKLSTVVWLLVIVVASFGLYMVKYKVQAIINQVAETSRELESKKEALHVVAAEWAYLNRPERLQALAEKYLSSSDLTVDQVADIQAIPFPAQREASLQPEDGVTQASMHMRGAGGAR